MLTSTEVVLESGGESSWRTYVPAGVMPVTVGYLGDAVGLTTGTTVFGAVFMALALVGGLVVLADSPRVRRNEAWGHGGWVGGTPISLCMQPIQGVRQ
ncbi:hypothetical protein BV401_21615 [Streptomyces malaysiensis subsp. malaysiensis]|uniref:Major facilitator superfamily (MFS) profile domain-containing protein n=1 Tax=Streptomyces autolyticus TaxID=75293 RepID=A0ABM6HET5_9ACTN|nr:hypothetical protein BV401_21615 [Streptomyces autolyticus]